MFRSMNGIMNGILRAGAATMLLAAALAFAPAAASAGESFMPPGILSPGDAVVTGFPGTLAPPQDLPAGADPLDYAFIDPDGPSMQIDRLLPKGPPAGQLIDAPALFSAPASEVGQVFAVTLDDAPAPNIYLGATSAFGIHIVAPDGSGGLRHVKQGEADAQFMRGQWGTDKGGAPGSIYRVDGTTGDISLFSSIGTNSGPGLGDVVFDRASRQFFVSDLDTGLIYRLDSTGLIADTFDHGTAGRPVAGLPPVADDGSRMDISAPAFNSEDPATWGLTAPERRVGGMALHGGRLYYAVAAGPQVWSVGINLDGSFRGDPRWELDVTGLASSNPVTDIAFDGAGRMILAQRGAQRGSFDDSVFADPKTSSVVRYRREMPDDPATPGLWVPVPDEYAVGFRPELRNTNGGVALGYGHDGNGALQGGSCNAFLWTTGEALRDDPALASQLASGGPATVDGLQGNDASLVKPANVPPFSSYFTDYDGNFDHPERQGWMGDVEIYQPCSGNQGYIGYPGYQPPGFYFPPGYQPPPSGSFNLSLEKVAAPRICLPGGLGWLCYYTIRVTNTGSVPYWGPVTVHDWMPGLAPGAVVSFGFEPPWMCGSIAPFDYQCTLPGAFLLPGDAVDLFVTVDQPLLPAGPLTPVNAGLCYAGNAAQLGWWGDYGDATPWDDWDYAEAQIPDPQCLPQGGGTNLTITKQALNESCLYNSGNWDCEFLITVTNTGTGVYNGPITVSEEPAMAGTVGYAPLDWNCVPSGGGNYSCTHPPVTLNPGQSVNLWFSVSVPVAAQEAAGRCALDNRAVITQAPGGSPGNLIPADDVAVASGLTLGKNCQPSLGKKSDLSITKRPRGCSYSAEQGGYACGFVVEVKNEGPDAFGGVLTVHDDPQPGGLAPPVFPPAWSCAAAGTGYDCTIDLAATPLAMGDSKLLPVLVVVPTGSQVCEVANKARIAAPAAVSDQNSLGSNDESALVSEPVDSPECNPPPPPETNLEIVKTATGCETGSPNTATVAANNPAVACSYRITLRNTGTIAASGGIAFSDQGAGATIVTPDDGAWTCSDPGSGPVCSFGGVLPAGATASFSAVVTTSVSEVRGNSCQVPNRATITAPIGAPMNNLGGDDSSLAVAAVPELCVVLLKQEYCPANRQMPDKGCCPEGQTWNGRQCSGGKTILKQCPAGSTGQYPNCVTTKVKTCPSGTLGTYPNCRTPKVKACPADSVGTYPNCRCAKGTTGKPGNCQPTQQCPKGTKGTWPNCQGTTAKCPRGTTGKWPNCQANVCPPGTIGDWPRCFKPERQRCPQGTVGKWPNCETVVKRCPKGTVGKWPNCERLDQSCPQGTYGQWPNCRKPNTNCPDGYVFSRKKQTCVPEVRRPIQPSQQPTLQPELKVPTIRIQPGLLNQQQVPQ